MIVNFSTGFFEFYCLKGSFGFFILDCFAVPFVPVLLTFFLLGVGFSSDFFSSLIFFAYLTAFLGRKI